MDEQMKAQNYVQVYLPSFNEILLKDGTFLKCRSRTKNVVPYFKSLKDGTTILVPKRGNNDQPSFSVFN